MRINIARFEKYGDAQALKHKLIGEYADKVFQVRAKKDGYYVVERRWNPSDPSETLSSSKRRKRRRAKVIHG